jgi:hypothetical protein
MIKPNWNINFEGLPEIPAPKQWFPKKIGIHQTYEQVITHKLFKGERIDAKEANQLVSCIDYYKVLKRGLEDFDFSSLQDSQRLEEFKTYIEYAYNFQPFHLNEVEIYQTFRLIRNRDKKSKITVDQLEHPSLDIVKDNGLFNRASTDKSTMFYSAESIDSAFKELKPKVGEVVTLGIWGPKDKTQFNCYPIASSSAAHSINETARSAFLGLNLFKSKMPKLLADFFDGYFDVLNHEYSKPVEHHLEYFVSAIFSERIVEIREEKWTFDAIIYPSVGNDYSHCNFAITPLAVKSKLKLIKAYELEITGTKYTNPSNRRNPTRLTVANAYTLRESRSIDESGKINWKK